MTERIFNMAEFIYKYGDGYFYWDSDPRNDCSWATTDGNLEKAASIIIAADLGLFEDPDDPNLADDMYVYYSIHGGPNAREVLFEVAADAEVGNWWYERVNYLLGW